MDWFDQIYLEINSTEVTTAGSAYRLVLSMILGAVVGYERKRKGQNAGVRTFSLISMGATLAMIISIYVPQEYLGLKNGDPGRIAAQVISGIGFLGAGAIIQMKGMYWLSALACALIMFILVQLERFEHMVSRGSESRIIRICTDCILHDIADYRKVLARHRINLHNFFVDYDYERQETRLNLVVLLRDSTDYIALFGEFEKLHPTKSITLANQLSI